ncbi:MAG: c-type cytochrome [Archaeoglobaceae archaeon]
MLARISKLSPGGLPVLLVLLALLAMATVSAQDGAEIYKENCQRCHADDGMGIRNANFSDPSYWKSTTKRDLINTVKNGVQIMPAYEEKLTDDEIDAVLEYTSDFAGVSYSEIPGFIPVIPGFTCVLCLMVGFIGGILLRR